jgi:deoxyribodipyrimidine photo-lyase
VTTPAIVWFRDDLRLADNPALARAVESGRPLVCVYVFEEGAGVRALGGAALWFLHGALAGLDESLRARGCALVVMRGETAASIEALCEATGAGAVFWNRRYGSAERAIDAALKTSLKARGVEAQSENAHLLREPWTVMNKAGEPFKVFSAFWRASLAQDDPPAPNPAPIALTFHATPKRLPGKTSLGDLALEPTAPDWAGGLRAQWPRGEAAAAQRLATFIDSGLNGYAEGRDRPDEAHTSRLSPDLRFGTISPRQILRAVHDARADRRAGARDADKFIAELGWREFSYHLLYHFPDLARASFQARFDSMPWRDDPAGLTAWRRGRTGYPLVDAGMRELWTTGWMHNRVRMVVASFLIKHLLIDWRAGEDWFWDTLVDADPANNAASWQWVAGSGADAAPNFRIFNPVLQGEKFDPDGAYVKRWIPELARLPASLVHRPWTATPAERAAAGVTLGKDYPGPIVDHAVARERALEALRRMSSSAP